MFRNVDGRSGDQVQVGFAGLRFDFRLGRTGQGCGCGLVDVVDCR
jgi:hypothetical protein